MSVVHSHRDLSFETLRDRPELADRHYGEVLRRLESEFGVPNGIVLELDETVGIRLCQAEDAGIARMAAAQEAASSAGPG